MEYEIRCPIKWHAGAIEIVTDGARLVATVPGEADGEGVLVFVAEDENATVQLLGPETKTVWTASGVEYGTTRKE